jgi:hypothetical protein
VWDNLHIRRARAHVRFWQSSTKAEAVVQVWRPPVVGAVACRRHKSSRKVVDERGHLDTPNLVLHRGLQDGALAFALHALAKPCSQPPPLVSIAGNFMGEAAVE